MRPPRSRLCSSGFAICTGWEGQPPSVDGCKDCPAVFLLKKMFFKFNILKKMRNSMVRWGFLMDQGKFSMPSRPARRTGTPRFYAGPRKRSAEGSFGAARHMCGVRAVCVRCVRVWCVCVICVHAVCVLRVMCMCSHACLLCVCVCGVCVWKSRWEEDPARVHSASRAPRCPEFGHPWSPALGESL